MNADNSTKIRLYVSTSNLIALRFEVDMKNYRIFPSIYNLFSLYIEAFM
ncbi:hypothetical protein C5S42_01325 [Candidatus Methanomarinus sp.]|nr:hypothetical protein C5S42_01325 [ANME-2 cluster archaeon]